MDGESDGLTVEIAEGCAKSGNKEIFDRISLADALIN